MQKKLVILCLFFLSSCISKNANLSRGGAFLKNIGMIYSSEFPEEPFEKKKMIEIAENVSDKKMTDIKRGFLEGVAKGDVVFEKDVDGSSFISWNFNEKTLLLKDNGIVEILRDR